jgi:hypothetical protein
MRQILLGVLLLHGTVAPLHAAAPGLTYLYPAGARRGTTVEIAAGGAFERWPVGIWASVKGVDVKPAKSKSKLIVKVAADTEPGICWLRLHDNEGASIARPFLIGTLPEVLEKEPNNEPKQAQKLNSAEVVVNGRLDKAGDVDAFAVSLRKGQILVASIEAHRTLHSPMDPVLQIVSEDGLVLAQNDDYRGFDPQIVFPVPHDGTFIVRLFAFPAAGDASIRLSGGETYIYRLTLTTGGFVDYPLPLAVSAAHPGEVDLVGWNVPDMLRKLPVPVPRTGDVATLLHPAIGNLVQVRVVPHFTLGLRTPTSRTSPQALPLPATVTGRLDKAGASDVFQLDGRKGQAVRLRIASRTLDFEVEPMLRLTDAAGKQLARAEAPQLNADAVLAFTPPQDGKYLLEVHDLHGEGGRRHVYRLDAETIAPDFALTVASDRFVLTPGTLLEIPVTITRLDGYAGGIDIAVEGLPAGVTAKAMAAKPADKTTKVTFAAAANADSSPLRIVGKASGLNRPAHAAIAKVAELDRATEDLWLTVRKTMAKK